MASIGNTSSNVVVPISNTNYYNNNPNSTISIITQTATSNLNHQHHPNPNVHIHHHPSPMISSSSSSTATTAATAVPQSKSMPDMSSYNTINSTIHHPMMAPSSSSNSTNNNNNDEEYKRKKRLARNRASARLRRLKKKNLVDSYEGEVGILESALGKLKMHRWGEGGTVSVPSSSSSNLNVYNNDNQYEGLIEALSMERGQVPLSPEARRQLIQSILDQQREQVGNLLEVQLENWMLCTSFLSGGSGGGGYGNNGNVEDEEMALVASELQSLLQLTPQQVSLMEQQNHQQQGEGGVGAAIMNEIQDLYSVEDCLQSIHSNMWLLDNGVEELSSQLTSILNPTQLSKFLLWSDHNAEAIEKLDFVNVVPLGGGGGEERGGEVGIGGPVFEFGVDEGLAEGD
jgi:hypothetical protein